MNLVAAFAAENDMRAGSSGFAQRIKEKEGILAQLSVILYLLKYHFRSKFSSNFSLFFNLFNFFVNNN